MTMRNLFAGTALALVAGMAPAITPALAQNENSARRDIRQAYNAYAEARLQMDAQIDSENATALATEAEAQLALLATLCAEAGYPELAACVDDMIRADNRFEGEYSTIPVTGNEVSAIVTPIFAATADAQLDMESSAEVEAEAEAPEAEEPPAEIVEDLVDETLDSAEETVDAATDVVEDVAADSVEAADDLISESMDEVAETSEETMEMAEEVSQEASAAVEDMAEDALEATDDAADELVDENAVEDVVAENPEAEVAPVLDSAKDETGQDAAVEAETDQNVEAETEVETAPAPTSDEDAQSDEVKSTEVVSTEAEAGEEVEQQKARQTRRQQLESAPENARVVESNDDNSGLRVVFEFNNQLIIRNNDDQRLQQNADRVVEEELRNGRTRTTIYKADGTRVVTIYNRRGDIVQRSIFDEQGREYVLVATPAEREEELLEWRDPGANLPPLRLTIPLSEYVLDVSVSSEDEVVQFLDQPPVEQVQRLYSVDEVKRSARIRDTIRRLEISDLTFETGSANLGTQQLESLEKVALAMRTMLNDNRAELFLIEGHTDAIGSEIANLRLSDLRAQTVAVALTQLFGIPAENLTTQGYGERYLKVRTQEAERANRRVTIKRITPLVSPTR